MKQATTEKARAGKVLVVDDSDELRELYEAVLTTEGYDVRTAPIAEEGLEIARDWRPDLVLTDLCMPGMGGLELITQFRSDFAPPLPILVAVSGFPDARDEALRRGAAHFETKPVSIDELRSIVAEALAGTAPTRLRHPDVIRERRQAARAIGQATLAKYLTEDPGLSTRIDLQAQMLGRFMGHSSVLVFLLRQERLELVASSNPELALGSDAGEIVPVVNDVVESAATLVVTRGVSGWLMPQGGSLLVRFLVAVPFVLDRAVVGALCLVDDTPHEFDGPTLGTIEYLARRGAASVRGAPHAVEDCGLLERAAFGAFLRGSVRSAHDRGRALGFAMFEVARIPSDGSLTALSLSLPAPCQLVGVLDSRHLVAFAVAESADAVANNLALTRRAIESHLVVTRCAELTYEDPIPCVELDVLVERARELLDRATAADETFLAMDTRRR